VTEPVHIVLVAAGGYGLVYLKGLLDQTEPERYVIDGVVDPWPENCPRLPELQAKGIPVFPTLAEFYRQRQATELVLVSSPIQFHTPDTVLALEHGSHVLCEKPLGATIQEAIQMQEAVRRTNRFVAIGYQWSYNKAVQDLKRDIQAGVFGAPKRFKTILAWPRDEQYFHRNNWAGKIKDAEGRWILDSPINNAAAHYLHNMFYVLGSEIATSARPEKVVAELYRANDIENFDTAALRCTTTDHVEILFYATHAVKDNYGPVFCYEFEHARVTYNAQDPVIRARFWDGSTREYGDPDAVYMKKLWDCMDMVRNQTPLLCGPEAASSQVLCINAAQESMPAIAHFPDMLKMVTGEEGHRLTWIQGLDRVLQNCYEKNLLPSERSIPWSKKGQEIDTRQYDFFPATQAS
jgi:predicted dehydrogenase